MKAVVVEVAKNDRIPRPILRYLRLWLATSVALLVLVPAGAEGSPHPVTTSTLPFVQVSAGPEGTCALSPDGDAHCWGAFNNEGESPATVSGPFTAISAGSDHTCAVRSDKSIDCWGSNFLGRAPAHVAGSFLSVSVGVVHTCALELEGDVVCWGDNEVGQAPPRVAGPFTSLSSGGVFACAVKVNRDIACWGYNIEHGAAPPLVSGPFTSVSAGSSSTCAVQADGDISCWGADLYGQAPAEVAGPFSAVASGTRHTCGLRPNGNVECWGENGEGQAPTEVAGPFKSVSAGYQHTCAIKLENLVSCWGAQLMMPAPPAAPGPAPTAGTVGTRYRHVFVAPASSPVTFSTQGALPTGLTLATTPSGGDRTEGTLSGVPRAVGTFTFTVSATNMFGVTSSDVTLEIGPTNGFDVNGDGLPDLAVGAPGENVGSVVDAGIVTVLYGAADGTYGRAGSLVISQETVGQVSEKGDRFGAAIAVAEVTGDDQLDLIIGAPGENAGAGQVVVVHGSPTGMTGAGRTVLRQGLDGAAGSAEAGDGFGSALSVGAGGWLWVGAPGEDYGSIANAGVVTLFPTRPMRATGSVQYHQGARGVPGVPERGDRFGASLAGGGAAIGAPGEDVGSIVDAGTVTWELTSSMSQNSAGVPGTAERGDQFGAAVSSRIVTTFDEENQQDVILRLLAVGAPGEDIGTLKDAGSVTLMWRLPYDAPWLGIVQSTSSSSSQRVEAGDRFGASVYLSSSGSSLIVGAPGEDVGSILDAGAVTVLPVGRWCIDSSCDVLVGEGPTHIQGRFGVPGVARAGNAFGTSVSELPGIAGGVVAGAPGQSVDGHSSAGTITVFNPSPLPAQELHQNSPGVSGAAENGDRFYRLSAP